MGKVLDGILNILEFFNFQTKRVSIYTLLRNIVTEGSRMHEKKNPNTNVFWNTRCKTGPNRIQKDCWDFAI